MAASACGNLLPCTHLRLPASSPVTSKRPRSSCFMISCESLSPNPTRRASLASVLLWVTSSPLSAALADTYPYIPPPMLTTPGFPGFKKVAETGVKLQDVIEGSGASASEGDVVEFNYVCRRSNGYFVYSTVDQFTGESSPVTFSLSDGKMIPGLKSVLEGMKPGGKRRAIVPPNAGYVTEDLEPQPTEFGPKRSLLSHSKEPLLFEVQLLKIK